MPRVFFSYTHDSDAHKERVLNLCNQLRQDGVDAWLDQYETAPPEGWPKWMIGQIEKADFVLVFCTETYHRRYKGQEEQGRGLGAQWEGAIITQQLYQDATRNTRFVPILFDHSHSTHIPITLKSTTYYVVGDGAGYTNLYRRLTDQPEVTAPVLGKPRKLN